jgi:CRP-like cAMP-binding protein
MNPGLSAADFDVGELIALLRTRAIRDGRWTPCRKPKGSVLIRQGQESAWLFVLQKGMVKLAYRTAAGDEWIKSFIADTGLFAANDPWSAHAPSRFTAECLEPCDVVHLPLAWAGAQISAEPRLLAAYAGFSAWVRRRKEIREEALLCDSAEERYRAFLATMPDLARRLRQGDIARFMRITPVALSRIKRRIAAVGTACRAP